MRPLPGTEASVATPTPAPDLRSAVLVAEDDSMFRHVLQKALSNWGYNVIAVEDGSKAWHILEGDDSPKLLVLDWMMPGLDGVELCRRIRSRKPAPYSYILLLTAKDNKRDLVNALNAGADDYLTKPFDVSELEARLLVGKRILALQAELIRTREELRFEAMHDRLTGLWNRGAILDFLQRELDRSRRTAQPLGLLMIDLDHFKNINDSRGHLVGDEVLKEASRRLVRSARSYDWVGRYGGEEFLVIVSNCAGEVTGRYAERVRSVLADTPVATTAGEVAISASIGAVAAEAEPYPEQDSLLRAADSALYRAKHAGRNCVQLG